MEYHCYRRYFWVGVAVTEEIKREKRKGEVTVGIGDTHVKVHTVLFGSFTYIAYWAFLSIYSPSGLHEEDGIGAS